MDFQSIRARYDELLADDYPVSDLQVAAYLLSAYANIFEMTVADLLAAEARMHLTQPPSD